MNKNKLFMLYILIFILLSSIAISFSYFSANLTGVETGTTITVTGGIMDMTFDGRNNITANNFIPKDTPFATKNFTVKGNNTTDLDMGYSLYLVVDENTFSNYSIKYKLISTNTGGSGTVVDSSSDFIPIKTGAGTTLLGFGTYNSPTSGNKVHSYTLEFYFPNLPFDQSIDQGKTFKAHINIKDYNLENDRIISSIDLMEKSKKAEMLYQYSDMLWDTVNKIRDQLSEEQLDYYNDLSNQYENQSDNLWDEIYSSNFLNTSIARYEIESIEFVESNIVPVSAIGSFDVSEKQNGSVMLWYELGINSLYKITIGQNGGVNAPIHFDCFALGIEFLYYLNGNLNTNETTTMSRTFSYAGFNSNEISYNFNSWDTSNVTDMSAMFSAVGEYSNEFELDLSSFNTSNVTNMSSMFGSAGSYAVAFNLDLSSFDTSKVTNMSSMFGSAGRNAETFNLNLSSFDTSKVTNMTLMFAATGFYAETFNLDLSSFDTSKVTNMSRMFEGVGSNSYDFNLNLSSFDTSNVTTMSNMFLQAFRIAEDFNLDLSSFDTSNVTDMEGMFQRAGDEVYNFNLDLSTWDTSSVTNMKSMFYYAGYEASTWTIGDISSWDISNVTNISNIFNYAGYYASTFFIGDIGSWNVSKFPNDPCSIILKNINYHIWDTIDYYNLTINWNCDM